jgi:hypothetical protein
MEIAAEWQLQACARNKRNEDTNIHTGKRVETRFVWTWKMG